MKLFTKSQMEELLKNGAIANRERLGEIEEEMTRKPVVKLFTPWGSATWLISEIDPDDQDIAFGLCDLGMGCPELGSVSIAELLSVSGPMGLRVERDLHWSAEKPLVAYADDARLHNAIQT
ncbi:MAG: DUF2958 domain-containing protein [Amylibacter sp.]|nr:DUF2958 domain-containing protein [Amylibacter sp.]